MENIGAIQVRPARLCGEEGMGPVLPCAMWEGEGLQKKKCGLACWNAESKTLLCRALGVVQGTGPALHPPSHLGADRAPCLRTGSSKAVVFHRPRDRQHPGQ